MKRDSLKINFPKRKSKRNYIKPARSYVSEPDNVLRIAEEIFLLKQELVMLIAEANNVHKKVLEEIITILPSYIPEPLAPREPNEPLIIETLSKKIPTAEEIAAKVPQPEPLPPLHGVDGRDGNPGKDARPEDVVPLVVEELKDKKIFGIKDVAGLEEILRNLSKKGGSSGGGGMGAWQHETPTGVVNGVNTAFTASSNIASGGRALIVLVNGQPQRLGTHYTVSSRTVTFTTAPETGDVVFFIYVR